jgi:hypothetical protein
MSRIDRLLNRLPKFLHPWTAGLRNAPVSHITSFLILHEITAIVPVVGLAAGFHYTGYLPTFLEHDSVTASAEKYERYFRRKGWFGLDEEHAIEQDAELKSALDGSTGEDVKGYSNSTRIVMEVATAYVITKALLPVRIIGSVWATPWFATHIVQRIASLRKR